MNKKNIALILSVVMTASVMLAGCGKKARCQFYRFFQRNGGDCYR